MQTILEILKQAGGWHHGLTLKIENPLISILERGDSYQPLVELMGGEMIEMSLDSDQTINPWDLPRGETKPSNDQISFLKNLTRHMLGENTPPDLDIDLLDSVLLEAIASTYKRCSAKTSNPVPLFGDLAAELAHWQDRDRNQKINAMAQMASTKLRAWVDEGPYARLFDRPTTVQLNNPWLYFNVEKLKDDPRLERAMTLLFVLGTLSLLLALSLGGHQLAWMSAQLLGLVTLSVVCFGLLWVVERSCSETLLPPRLLANRVVWRAALAVLLFASVLFGLIVQLPLFLQAELGVSTAASGLLLIPLTVAQVVVSTATGLRISSTGKPRNAMLYGLAGVSVGFAALVAILRSGAIPIAIITLLIGAGLGSTMPAAQDMVQWAAGDRDLGEATAALSFSRSIGGVLGAAITSALLLAALHTGGQIASLTNSTGGASALHASAALSRGFLWMFSTLGVLALMATITTWSLPNIDLSKPQGQA